MVSCIAPFFLSATSGGSLSRSRRDLFYRLPRPVFSPDTRRYVFHNRYVWQISPDKNVNCRYTTVAFTLSPKPWTSSCCADLPGDWALYAVSVRRLMDSESSLTCTPASSRPSLTETPLPSASIYVNKS
jgi:hypothetical protein